MLCMFIHLRVYESCSPRVITKSDSGVVSTSLPTICQPSRIAGYIDITQRKNMDDGLEEGDDDDDGVGFLRADNAAQRIRQAITDHL